MSFDIFIQPIRFGTEVVKVADPVSGELKTHLPNDPLTEEEVRAVQRVLKEVGAELRDEFGCYVVEVDDGGSAEVFGDHLETGCMIALRGLSPHLVEFIYQLLKAGRWGAIPAMEDAVTIVTSLEVVKRAPADIPEIVVCESAVELGVLLQDGVQAWTAYRKKICGSGK